MAIAYHVYIRRMSPQLSCGNICQIWMSFEQSNSYFCNLKMLLNAKLTIFSTPHPGLREITLVELLPALKMKHGLMIRSFKLRFQYFWCISYLYSMSNGIHIYHYTTLFMAMYFAMIYFQFCRPLMWMENISRGPWPRQVIVQWAIEYFLWTSACLSFEKG